MCVPDWPQACHPHLSASIGWMCASICFFVKIAFILSSIMNKKNLYFTILGHFEFQLFFLVIVLVDSLKLLRIMNTLVLI